MFLQNSNIQGDQKVTVNMIITMARSDFYHPILKNLMMTIQKSGAQRLFDHPVLKHLMITI